MGDTTKPARASFAASSHAREREVIEILSSNNGESSYDEEDVRKKASRHGKNVAHHLMSDTVVAAPCNLHVIFLLTHIIT